MYKNDNRVVLTLDAGGTNLVFSAIRAGEEIVEPVHISTNPHNINSCLDSIVEGFKAVSKQLTVAPVALSFAFPGPADYQTGIIGDLPNFPAFRGGVALGPFLQDKFGVPVFINNDGDLFAYGEALTGVLPELNKNLEAAGSIKRYKNLVGLTLGTGFGAGVVIDGNLLHGDNAAGGDVWCLRNKKYTSCIIEESVSIRAVKRVYAELSGDKSELTPKDIYNIAEGTSPGNKMAAIEAFTELGEMAGDTLASVLTLIDGVAVIGGGLTGASKYIVPAMLNELNGMLGMMSGERFPRLQMKAYNLDDQAEFELFAKGAAIETTIPGTDRKVLYDPLKRTGIMVSKQGTSRSIALGAYVYALNHL